MPERWSRRGDWRLPSDEDHFSRRSMVEHLVAAPHLDAGRAVAVEEHLRHERVHLTVRFGRDSAGWRNASAALTRRPLRMVAIV